MYFPNPTGSTAIENWYMNDLVNCMNHGWWESDTSAIADHDMSAGKYFMLNAAVASEAFDVSQWIDSPVTANVMAHDYWRNYTNACWSAKWHEFYMGSPSDDRRLLTWKDRFGCVLKKTAVWNFPSSGDEVFELFDGTPGYLDGLWSSGGRYSWHKQETHKGRYAMLDPAGTSWAGWGFSENGHYGGNLRLAPYTAYAANIATPSQLTQDPVFVHSPNALFQSTIAVEERNTLLAKGFPALSGATGRIALNSLPTPDQRNIDMNTVFKPDGNAWGRSGVPYYQRWLHSDMNDMAFFYTHKLFEKLVEEGGLK